MSYADVVTMARRAIPLGEIDVQAVTMKKAVTGAIVIRVPGDKDREKAFFFPGKRILATRLAGVLDPTKVRVGTPMIKAELRVTNIDISMDKEELRQALALAAGCSSEDVQVGEIGASRGGLGSAWIKCPVAGARKLAQAGKVILGWSIARVSAIPKRPLQCYKCLELGHVPATCTSTEERSHLCYRCGGSGHRARGCPASAPKSPLCELLGAPSDHRMRGARCAPPKVNKKKNQPASHRYRHHRRRQRESRRQRRRDSSIICSNKWPGGGHGVGGVTSIACSNAMWEEPDGRKTCFSRPSGRIGSHSRWWPNHTASPLPGFGAPLILSSRGFWAPPSDAATDGRIFPPPPVASGLLSALFFPFHPFLLFLSTTTFHSPSSCALGGGGGFLWAGRRVAEYSALRRVSGVLCCCCRCCCCCCCCSRGFSRLPNWLSIILIMEGPSSSSFLSRASSRAAWVAASSRGRSATAPPHRGHSNAGIDLLASSLLRAAFSSSSADNLDSTSLIAALLLLLPACTLLRGASFFHAAVI